VEVLFLILGMSGGNIFATNTFLKTNDTLNNSHTNSSINNKNYANINDVYVSTTGNDNGNGTISSPYQSLSKAIQIVNENGTIHVSNGVYSGVQNRELVLNKSMEIIQENTIAGVGNVVKLDAESLTQIITLNGQVNVTLDNLIFANGKYNQGGALDNDDGCLIIKNCKFEDNSGNVAGGAISNGFNTTIINSSFDSNIANSTDGAIGGAISNFGTLNLEGCNFNSNIAGCTAGSSGGAISNFGDANLMGCNFNFNTAGCYDGGVGGAIFTNDGSLYIDDCTFDSNLAGETVGSHGAGGAVVTMGGTTNISHSSFTKNIGGTGGGAIYCLSDLFIDNSNFISNQAGSYGGAIVSVDDVNIASSSFSYNIANYGGVIDNYNGTCNITGSNFLRNFAQTNGGSFYNAANGTMDIERSTFDHNMADSSCGGAVFNKGNLAMHFNEFVNNPTNIYGNATTIYNYLGYANLTQNYWDTNDDPTNYNYIANEMWFNNPNKVDISNWIIMNINTTPSTLKTPGTSTVTVDFNHLNNGNSVTGGSLPDQPVILDTTAGSFSNITTTDETNGNTFNGSMSATLYINQSIKTPIIQITATSPMGNGNSRTIINLPYNLKMQLNKSNPLLIKSRETTINNLFNCLNKENHYAITAFN
jgi:predicted outer membrane repeat protein